VTETSPKSTRLRELASIFLKLGVIAFGGPAAHIAMMEEEIVRRRQWLSHAEFLDLLGATNLIPGPNSTEMAIHIGRRRAGWAGLLVAGTSFILPAAIIVAFLAWVYLRVGSLPQVQGVLYGIKPVIVAIVIQALWGLTKTAVQNLSLALVGILAAMLNAVGVHELLVLFGAALLVATGKLIVTKSWTKAAGIPLLLAQTAALPLAAGTAATTTFSLSALFLFFLKAGSVLFGSGYVLLAFLRADLVERWGWLSEQQLLDAIAVGQFTPGPVFTTATFIGWILGGWQGAVLATIGIFLPAFIFVAVSSPIIPKLRRSVIAGAMLDGINVASLALMAVVTAQLTGAALVDWFTVVLLLVAAFLLLKWRVNSAWLVLGGALVGLFINALGWNS